MGNYVNIILYRAALFWAGVPPEALAAILLVVLVRPEAIIVPVLSIAGFILKAIAGEFVSGLITGFFLRHVWPMLPLPLQNALAKVRGWTSPDSKARAAGHGRSAIVSKYSRRHPHW